MSDGLESEAVLRLRVIEDLEGFIRKINAVQEGTGQFGGDLRRLEKILEGTNSRVKDLGSSVDSTNKSLRNNGADQASKSWDQLTERVSAAGAAYRNFRQEVALGRQGDMGVDQWIAQQPNINRSDLESYRRGSAGSLLGDDTSELREQERLMQKRINDEVALRREMERRADVARQIRITEDSSAIRASNSAFMGDVGSRVGQPSTGQSARNTGLAASLIAEEAAAARARKGLADYDRQLNSNSVSYKASTSALAAQLIKTEELANELPRMRYAMYDVAQTAGIMSTAIVAAEVATLAASASFESSFTAVERTSRTSGAAADSLRGQLIGLTRDIPAAFSEVANVATLGAQLDIASGDLSAFSEQVIQFSATTGVAADASAEGFGRIGQLLKVPAAEYRNLGSAILYAGNTSVATEQDVLNYSQRIAIAGNETGLTADQVVALSATLASLGIGLEAAQGATQRVFQQIKRDVSEGGDALQKYANITGMSADAFAASWRGDPQAALSALIDGLSRAGDMTAALDSLGIVETREVRAMTALANNTDLYNQLLEETNLAYQDGTYLAESYGMVVDDLASRWQIFLNAVMEFGAAAGDAIAPAAIAVLDFLSGILQGLADMLATPTGQWLATFALGLMGVVAVLGALVAAGALSIGTLAALRTAVDSLGWGAAATGVRGFVAGVAGIAPAAGAAAVGVNVFKAALISTGIGAVVVLLGTLAAAFTQSGQSAENAFNNYIGSTGGLTDALAADREALNQALADGNAEMVQSFTAVTPATQENTAALDSNAQAISNTASVLGMTPAAYGSANDALTANTQYLGENTLAWVKNALLQNEAFQNLAGNQDFTDYWTTIGANMEEVIRASATGGEAAVYDYFQRLENAATTAGAKFQRAFSVAGRTRFGSEAEGGALITGLNRASGNGIGEVTKIVQGLQSQISLAGFSGKKSGAQIAAGMDEAATSSDRLAKSIGGGGSGGGGGVTKKIVTLVDYANGLQSVMSRAFDIRYGGDQAFDSITSGWQRIAQAAEDAREAADAHRRKLADLGADRDVKAYWLTVAEMYDDELRAAELRAELANISADMAKEQKGLANEQDKASLSLEGNSDAAIQNRASILGLVGDYQSYLQALAASGMSQADLEAKSRQLKEEFIRQAVQMGYSRTEVDRYARSFDDMAQIIQRIPRNVTIDFNGDAALTAMNEFKARAQAAMNAGGGISVPVSTYGDTTGAKQSLDAEIEAMRGRLASAYAATGGNSNIGTSRLESALTKLLQSRSNLGYYTGGYTGDGGKFEPRGVVHGGEFVFSKAATDAIGVNTLSRVHTAAKTGRPFSPAASAGSRIVELSPYDRQLLMDISSKVGVTIAESSLQSAVNGANSNQSQRRSS